MYVYRWQWPRGLGRGRAQPRLSAVTEAAVAATLSAVTRFERGGFAPEALDECQPDVRGCVDGR